ncbi:MAG: acyltransferase [Prevotella sp.]|nr:acyltransferase [Prevotella sp.]
MDNPRDTTLDIARGCCMLSILLFHTEVYYTGEEIIPYACHVDNSLLTFTFISGYFFCKTPIKDFTARQKLRSIFRGIFLPYLLFTTILALPKALVKSDVTLFDELWRIATGHASWYVAALMVAEVLFTLLLRFARHLPHPTPLLFAGCILPFIAIAVACHLFPEEQLQAINLWCWQSALVMLPFLFAGMLWRQEDIMKWLDHPMVMVVLTAIVVVMKYMVVTCHLTFTLEPLHVSSFALLLLDGMAGALLIIGICRRIPQFTSLQFIGRHSLIYYFFCGAVPMAVSMVLNKCGMPYQGSYCQVLLAFIIVCIGTTAITWAIVKMMSK